MDILKKLNELYGKYLYAIVPSLTLIIAVIEIINVIRRGEIMRISAFAMMGFVSLAFCGFYLMSQKKRASYCLIEIWLFLYTVFLMLDDHMHFGNIAWIIFLPLAISVMIFIVLFNRKGN